MTQPTCESAQCVWSTGKELTGERDFCAPAEINQDAMTFKNCGDLENEPASPSCQSNPVCKWYTVSAPVEEGDCVSIDRFSASYVATADNCMNVKTQDKCSNL
jgi:hypothetical protein